MGSPQTSQKTLSRDTSSSTSPGSDRSWISDTGEDGTGILFFIISFSDVQYVPILCPTSNLWVYLWFSSVSLCNLLLAFQSPASGLHFKTKTKMLNSMTETKRSIYHGEPHMLGVYQLQKLVTCWADKGCGALTELSEILLYRLYVYRFYFMPCHPFFRAIFPSLSSSLMCSMFRVDA